MVTVLAGLRFNPNFSAQADQALTLYYAQLGLNLLWTPLFFGGRSKRYGLSGTLMTAKQKEIALGNILALTGTVLAMTVKMHGLNTPFSTTWFLAPYCAWLGYGMFPYATLDQR